MNKFKIRVESPEHSEYVQRHWNKFYGAKWARQKAYNEDFTPQILPGTSLLLLDGDTIMARPSTEGFLLFPHKEVFITPPPKKRIWEGLAPMDMGKEQFLEFMGDRFDGVKMDVMIDCLWVSSCDTPLAFVNAREYRVAQGESK